MTFAESLKNLRIEKGLSQQQLADMMFVDRSSITRWESGTRVPDALMVSRLSTCLDADIAELLALSERPLDTPNVILLDDEKIILYGGMPVLEEALPSAAISGFTKPSEALRFAKDNRVSIAFLDIELGNTSGMDICAQLLEINPRTNVIFLTAYANYALDAWETGACGFLVKPLSVESVRKTLSNMRYPVRGLMEND